MPLLSFVIPCYRSEKTIGKVIEEIKETVAQKSEFDYEIICVNDGSPDNVYVVLKKLAEVNPRLKVLNLAKNMGKHAAVMAGYSVVKGDYVVNLDDDCQCPVFEFWKLIEPVYSSEYDISMAEYKEKKEKLWKRIGSAIDRKMASYMIGLPDNIRISNFSVMKRYIIDELIKYPHAYPYINGLLLQVTHNICMVKMDERERGDNNATGFTLKKSLSLFLNGFTAFSVLPLRVATISGFMFAMIGFILTLYFIIRKIISPDILIGYSSIVSILLGTSGIIMVLIGMLGEYIGRIYICINKAPQYVVKERINSE